MHQCLRSVVDIHIYRYCHITHGRFDVPHRSCTLIDDTGLDVFQIGVMMEDLRVFSCVLISILYIFSTTTILMRIYVRGLTMRSFWWDDWVMTAMVVSSG